MFVGFVWLTSNHMFGSGDFWDKSLSWFLNILKLPSFYSGNFKIFKNTLGQFIPNCQSKHVITSTSFLNFNEITIRKMQNYLKFEVFWKELESTFIHLVFICSRNINLKIYKIEKIVNRNWTDEIRAKKILIKKETHNNTVIIILSVLI